MSEIVPPQRNEAWLNSDLTPTLRFAEYVESMTGTSNSTQISITNLDDGVSTSARVAAGNLEKDLDDLIGTMQAPLYAKVAQLEKKLSEMTATMEPPLAAKVGELEKELTGVMSTMQVPTRASEPLPDLSFTTPMVFREFVPIVKNTAYTAVDGDFVEANSKAVITLDSSAGFNDQVIIANGDGSKITVMGDIKYSSVVTSLTMRNKGTSLHFHKFGGYWRAR